MLNLSGFSAVTFGLGGHPLGLGVGWRISATVTG